VLSIKQDAMWFIDNTFLPFSAGGVVGGTETKKTIDFNIPITYWKIKFESFSTLEKITPFAYFLP
jgi:hypothetical protein